MSTIAAGASLCARRQEVSDLPTPRGPFKTMIIVAALNSQFRPSTISMIDHVLGRALQPPRDLCQCAHSLRANCTDILRLENKPTRRCCLAAVNLTCFADAFNQFAEKLFSHLNSSDTTCFRSRFSRALRSSRAPFEYASSM